MFSAVVSALDESIGRIVQVGFGASLVWSSSIKTHWVAWPFVHPPYLSILVSIWIHLNISKNHPTVSNPSECIWIHPRCSNLLISMRTQFYCLWGTMEGFISGKVWHYFLDLLVLLVTFCHIFFCSWETMGRFILSVGESKRISIFVFFATQSFGFLLIRQTTNSF